MRYAGRPPLVSGDIFAWLIVLLPVLGQYTVVRSVSLGLTICLVALAVYMRIVRFALDHRLVAFVALVLLQTPALALVSPAYLDTPLMFKSLVTLLAFVLICVAMPGLTDAKRVYSAYRVSVLIVLIMLLAEVVAFYAWHRPAAGWFIPGLRVPLSDWAVMLQPRFHSLLSEPAALTAYLMPMVLLSVVKREYWLSALCVAGILLSTSSLGIVFVIGFMVELLVRSSMRVFRSLGTHGLGRFLLLLVLVSVTSAVLWSPWSVMTVARDKLLGINIHEYSDYNRLLRGWDIYWILPAWAKLWGVGLHNIGTYVSTAVTGGLGIAGASETVNNYASALSSAFVQFGLVGGGLFVWVLAGLARGLWHTQFWELPLILVYLSFVTQSFFNPLFCFYLMLIYVLWRDTRLSERVATTSEQPGLAQVESSLVGTGS